MFVLFIRNTNIRHSVTVYIVTLSVIWVDFFHTLWDNDLMLIFQWEEAFDNCFPWKETMLLLPVKGGGALHHWQFISPVSLCWTKVLLFLLSQHSQKGKQRRDTRGDTDTKHWSFWEWEGTRASCHKLIAMPNGWEMENDVVIIKRVSFLLHMWQEGSPSSSNECWMAFHEKTMGEKNVDEKHVVLICCLNSNSSAVVLVRRSHFTDNPTTQFFPIIKFFAFTLMATLPSSLQQSLMTHSLLPFHLSQMFLIYSSFLSCTQLV